MTAASAATPQGDENSPCVHVCLMDYAQGLCIGCLRTLDEITYWVTYSPEQKRAVHAQIAARRDALNANP